MATTAELLARLRAKTANPAGETPKINVAAAIVEQEKKEPPKSKLVSETKLGYEFREKLLQLETMMYDRHPLMPNLLREIHVALKKQPENVLLLNDEEINVIFTGLEKQTGVEVASTAAKSAKTVSGKAKAAKISAAALGL